MQIHSHILDLREQRARFRSAGETVGFVPTMGALHEGHMALIATALARHPRVIVSIFVNPTQFGEQNDLETYPRTFEADCELLRGAGVDAVFAPEAREIYPEGDQTIVETVQLANMLHGALRPGHYRGVTTVVTKLFNIVQPDAAYFGEKDYQQLQVIRAMVRDLFMPITIHGVPTQRAPDGLALSSRNRRLTPEDRAAAPVLSRALDAAAAEVARGTSVEALRALISETINGEPRADLKAIDIVASRTLAPVSGPIAAPVAIMLSARFGDVLLIDQREVAP